MTFYPNDRIALFIDGANLYSAAKGLGFDIDYKKLLAEFRTRGVLVIEPSNQRLLLVPEQRRHLELLAGDRDRRDPDRRRLV